MSIPTYFRRTATSKTKCDRCGKHLRDHKLVDVDADGPLHECPRETYRTFLRSARSFEEFANARKRTVDRGLSYDEARRACQRYNENREPWQVSRGTKLEFDRE